MSKPNAATLGRQELYERVWATPIVKLAAEFGISDRGLAKICDRMTIPCPPRGYWARKAAGQKVAEAKLPTPAKGTHLTVTISPTPPAEPPPKIPDEIVTRIEEAKSKAGDITVSDRLNRPHAIIAKWIEERAERRREARENRRFGGYGYDPGEFTAVDKREHRILDAFFKAIERAGGKVKQTDRRQLVAVMDGEGIEFDIRQKQRQVRRPPTAEEKRSSFTRDKEFIIETKTTDVLVFRIKTYLPGRLRQEWLEKDDKPLEDTLPDIVGVFVAAGPLLVEQRLEREERARQSQIAERKRYEAEQARKRDDNRWHMFGRFAAQAQEVERERNFLAALKAKGADPAEMVGDMSLADWIAWAERRIERDDPLLRQPKDIFASVAEVNEWNYREDA